MQAPTREPQCWAYKNQLLEDLDVHDRVAKGQSQYLDSQLNRQQACT